MTATSKTVRDQAARRRRLLNAVRTCAERDGVVPGVRRFAQEVGERRHIWSGHLWPSWGAFLREAGLTPGVMTQPLAEEELLSHLAELTREHGRFPSSSQLRFAHAKKPERPGEKTFRNRFGGHPEMFQRLRDWVDGKPDYADVQAILVTAPPRRVAPAVQRVSPASAENISMSPPLLSDSFIPPVVDCLPALAAGDADIERQCTKRGLELSVELERRVAIVFRILGLSVNILGQGAGRVADGIAWCRPGRWAVVYDTKVRRGGFVMGTEDRKFREYIERHGKDLEREGIDAIYFAVISSSFDESDVVKAREVVRLTKAKAFVLLEASALRALAELKLRTRVLDDWEVLQRLFTLSNVVGLADVQSLRR